MKKLGIIWMLLICMLFSGCNGNDDIGDGKYILYQVNFNKGMLEKTEFPLNEESEVLTITDVMKVIEDQEEYEIAVLPAKVKILSYELAGDILKIHFNSEYRTIPLKNEILYRMAIVKNFVQVEGINYVQIYIEDADLLDISGTIIGPLESSSFIEYSGKNLGDYQSKRLTLYFANEKGDKLLTEERTVYYSTSAPIEKVIVEQLIAGPSESGRYATVPSTTGILGVSVTDDVVYVNLDQKFSSSDLVIPGELSVYSIVNSVLSVGNAKAVQIFINGDSKLVYKETISLNQNFEFNMSVLEETPAIGSRHISPGAQNE